MTVYFDNAATTPLSPAAMAALVDGLAVYGNPAAMHGAGFAAERLLNEAAGGIAACLGVPRDALVFVSGGTEGNNMAFGALGRGGVVTMATEHPSVLEAARARGGVTLLRPMADGRVDLDELAAAVVGDTAIVSVMAVNNETGALQDIGAIGALVKRANPKALFHVDGVQAFGKVRVDLARVDLYTFCAHKIHGPKGIGALYIRPGLHVPPLIVGGGHQRGLRAGTENPAAVAAFAAAAREAFERLDESAACVKRINDCVRDGVLRLGGHVNSPPGGSPYILNVSFPGVMPEALLNALSGAGVYVSAGSACSSRAKMKRSRFGVDYGWAREFAESALRFSFSRYNTPEEAGYAVEALGRVLPELARRR